MNLSSIRRAATVSLTLLLCIVVTSSDLNAHAALSIGTERVSPAADRQIAVRITSDGTDAGTPVTGISVTVTDGSNAAVSNPTNNGGWAIFPGLSSSETYTISVPTAHPSWDFALASGSLTPDLSLYNKTTKFSAIPLYAISGTISGMEAGVDVVLDDATSTTVQTVAGGAYTFTRIPAGNYSVTPDASNHRATPGSIDVTGLSADASNVDFSAVTVYTVSGTITKLSGSGSTGYDVTLSGDESQATTTAADGSYAFTVADGNYTVTPSRANWGFSPTDSSFVVSGAALGGIDFTTRTVLRAPALTAPADASADAALTPTFEWTSVGPNPDRWLLRIDDDADVTDAPLATIEVDKASESYALAYATLALDYASTYYWSVTAERTTPQLGDEEQASSVWSFTTGTNAFATTPPVVSYPNNDALVYSTTPALNWYITTGSTDLTWEVQIKAAASADWSTLVHTSGELADVRTYTPPSGALTAGSAYVWRAVVKDLAGGVLGVSDAASFEIFGTPGPAIPTASWPVGGATIYSTQPSLNWYTSGGSASLVYHVELAPASAAFTGTPTFTTTPGTRTVDLAAEAVTLMGGTNYQWRVRSTDGSATSDWSTTALFTTVASAGVVTPTASYPSGGALLYSTDARLSWYLGAAASGLSYVVTLTPDGGSPTIYPPTNGLFLDVTGLTPGADYTWSVAATDGNTSATSDPATFSVFQAVAASAGKAVASWPVAQSGSDAPIVRTRNPTLSWWVDGARADIARFRVEWGTDPTFATTERSRNVAGSDAASVVISPALDWATTYYWRVGAVANGESDPVSWSEGTFATLGEGGALIPVASYPTNDPTIYTDEVTMSWYVSGAEAAVAGYTVQYATSSDFTTGVVERRIQSSPLAVRRLTAGQTYHWRVQARLTGGQTTGWSAAETFTMKSDGIAPTAPRVGSPSRGVTVATSTPQLSWYVPTGAEAGHTFEVELSTRGDFDGATRFESLSSMQTSASNLQDGIYFWRVRSARGGNTSAWTDAGTFRIQAGTSTAAGEEIAVTEVTLTQAAPNPSRGAVRIGYALPEAGAVRLSVYDLMGREVAVLIDSVEPAGARDVVWSGEGLSAGTYLYRLQTQSGVLTRTLTLVR